MQQYMVLSILFISSTILGMDNNIQKRLYSNSEIQFMQAALQDKLVLESTEKDSEEIRKEIYTKLGLWLSCQEMEIPEDTKLARDNLTEFQVYKGGVPLNLVLDNSQGSIQFNKTNSSERLKFNMNLRKKFGLYLCKLLNREPLVGSEIQK